MLTAYLAAEARKPFVWGETDCATTADRWAARACGFSPLAIYGRRIDGADAAAMWLTTKGGLAWGLRAVMRAAGFARTRAPAAGDIGLVRHGPLLCVGIWTGALWFSRSEAGLIGAPRAAAIAAWSIA